MNPAIVSSAILLGVVIGWLLATQVHGLAWEKLYKLQRQTLVHQNEALKIQSEYTDKLKDLIKQEQGLREQWTKINGELQAALAIREQAKAELESAIELREKAQRETGEVSC